MATVIVFVDGFNLYHGLRDKYRRRYLWLDLEHLVRRLRTNDRIVAVRYFTALVVGGRCLAVPGAGFLGREVRERGV